MITFFKNLGILLDTLALERDWYQNYVGVLQNV